MSRPLLVVITASAAEADCLADALAWRYVVTRRGTELEVSYEGLAEPPIDPLLETLEDCLTENDLPPIRLQFNGNRYMMYARSDA
jgi:hypothetical protein